MISLQQKNIVSYELYAAKKQHQPDHLCALIRKNQKKVVKEAKEDDQSTDLYAKKAMNEKRVKQILKERRNNEVSTPDPYIKRTWLSPIEKIEKSQQGMLHCIWKKNIDRNSTDQ